jgi:histidinol-phosphate aminotransferase
VCNPNAPTGTFISVGELASLADEVSGVLLIDEAYVDFAEDNCTRLAKDFDNVIILRSMSKGYSLAGMRFGYAIARPKDRKYFRQTCEKVKRDREILTAQLRALKLNVPNSSANFVLAESKNCKASQIYDKLVQRNIYVRYFDLPHLSGKLRITVGTEEQNDKLILALKEILSE